jgi:predicted ATPase
VRTEVCFVDLAPVTGADRIATTALAALGFVARGSGR